MAGSVQQCLNAWPWGSQVAGTVLSCFPLWSGVPQWLELCCHVFQCSLALLSGWNCAAKFFCLVKGHMSG